jgi:4'-phosphopantetheinyl transferase
MCVSGQEAPVLSRCGEGTDTAVLQYPGKMNSGDVHIWRAELSRSRTMLAKLEEYLAADELKRANRFVFARDRQSFVVAHGLLRLVLAHYLGEDPRLLQFVYGAQGKPALAVNPSAVFFNMSHSCDRILIAVGTGSEVGVDIEKVEAELAFEGVSGAFSRAEQFALANVSADKRLNAFFKCWTSKEAYIKGIGEGLAVTLADFDVCVDPDRPHQLLRPLNRRGSNWFLHRLDEGNEYVATLATACPDVRLSLFDVGEASAREAAEGGSLIGYSR